MRAYIEDESQTKSIDVEGHAGGAFITMHSIHDGVVCMCLDADEIARVVGVLTAVKEGSE